MLSFILYQLVLPSKMFDQSIRHGCGHYPLVCALTSHVSNPYFDKQLVFENHTTPTLKGYSHKRTEVSDEATGSTPEPRKGSCMVCDSVYICKENHRMSASSRAANCLAEGVPWQRSM